MDKQLLDGLDNLSEALVMIAEALDKKGQGSNSATTNALVSGDFTKQIKEINTGILSIKKDTKKILENQQTILEMSKKKDKKSSLIEEVGEDQKAEGNLKKGVTTILLIAVGVLAIGLAFKLIGKIDFLSVVGLAMAMVLVSIAFEKIAKLKLDIKEAFMASAVMVIMSVAITMSSWVLGLVRPIGFGQALTAILIAGMFSVISFGIGKLIKAFKDTDIATAIKSSFLMVLLLPAIAVGIAVSSWALAMVRPIGFGQAITAILIAGMFTVISFGIGKLVNAFKDIDPASAFKVGATMVLLLPAMALAIAASSYALSLVKPIGFEQFVTALAISIIFIALAFAMNLIMPIFKKLKWEDVIKIPALFTTLAIAIMLSSWILSASADITFMKMLKILVFSVIFAIALVVMGIAALVLTKIGVTNILKGLVAIIAIATAITLSSLILDEGKYSNYPGFMWTLFTGLSLVVFGVVADLLNTIGSVASFVKGGIAILIVAATIMATSHILNLGKYNKYPSLEWVIGVGAGLAAFGIAAVLLGTQVLNPFFYGGLAEILLVAGTIVATSHILAAGKYGNYPKASWVMGVGLAIGAFGLAAIVLGTQVLNPFFYAGLGEILLVSGTIVESSKILAKGNYKGGPSLAWATGVSMLLGAFGTAAVVLGILPKSFFKDGISAIKQIAQVIPDVSKILAKGNYKGGPTLAWAAGTGLIMTGFSAAIVILGVLPKMFVRDGITAIKQIAQVIPDVSKILAKGNYKGGPTLAWAAGTGALLTGFGAAIVILGVLPKMFVRDGVSAITQITNVIPNVSKILAKGNYKGGPDLKWGAKTSGLLSMFAAQVIFLGALPDSLIIDGALAIKRVVMSIVNTSITFWNNKKYFKPIDKNWITSLKSTVNTFLDIVKQTKKVSVLDIGGVQWMAHKLVDTAAIIWKGRKFFSTIIDPNYIKNLSGNILGFATLAKKLTNLNKGTGLVKSFFGLDPVSQTANSMVKLAGAYDKMATALKKFGGALASIDAKKVDVIRRLTGNMAVLAAMNEQAFSSMMTTLESKGSVFAKLLDVDKGKTGPVVGEGKDKKGVGLANKKPKGKYGETHEQLDIMIDLLNNINRNTSSLDDFLAKQGFKADALLDLTMKK